MANVRVYDRVVANNILDESTIFIVRILDLRTLLEWNRSTCVLIENQCFIGLDIMLPFVRVKDHNGLGKIIVWYVPVK